MSGGNICFEGCLALATATLGKLLTMGERNLLGLSAFFWEIEQYAYGKKGYELLSKIGKNTGR